MRKARVGTWCVAGMVAAAAVILGATSVAATVDGKTVPATRGECPPPPPMVAPEPPGPVVPPPPPEDPGAPTTEPTDSAPASTVATSTAEVAEPTAPAGEPGPTTTLAVDTTTVDPSDEVVTAYDAVDTTATPAEVPPSVGTVDAERPAGLRRQEPAPPPKVVLPPMKFSVDWVPGDLGGFPLTFARDGNPCGFKDVYVTGSWPKYATWRITIPGLGNRDCTAKITVTDRTGKSVVLTGTTQDGGAWGQYIEFNHPMAELLTPNTVTLELACSGPKAVRR